MPRDGSGNYAKPLTDVVADTTILATWANTTIDDIAAALSQSLAKDGQTNPTANLPMNTFRHTGVGNATARDNYLAVGQAVDGVHARLTSVGGTADAITATGPFNLAAYVTGQRFSFVAGGTNTGAVTINIGGIGAKSITKNGTTALAAGDITSASVVEIWYDGTQFQMVGGPFVARSEVAAAAVAAVGIAFASGDSILFRNAGSPPAGWTVASITNRTVRIMDATPTSGGNVDFNTAFASQAVSGNISSESSHTHGYSGTTSNEPNIASISGAAGTGFTESHSHNFSGTTNAGSAHSHNFSGTAINLAVRYYDFNVIVKT